MIIDGTFVWNQDGDNKYIMKDKDKPNIMGIIEKEYSESKEMEVWSIKYYWNKVFQEEAFADELEEAKKKLKDILGQVQNQTKHIQTFESFIKKPL